MCVDVIWQCTQQKLNIVDRNAEIFDFALFSPKHQCSCKDMNKFSRYMTIGVDYDTKLEGQDRGRGGRGEEFADLD